jgi:hypothetical protein
MRFVGEDIQCVGMDTTYTWVPWICASIIIPETIHGYSRVENGAPTWGAEAERCHLAGIQDILLKGAPCMECHKWHTWAASQITGTISYKNVQ